MCQSRYKRDRSKFYLCIYENEDGSCNIVISPYLSKCIDFHFPELKEASPIGWQSTASQENKILWIPADKISNIDLNKLKLWADNACNHCLWLSPTDIITTHFAPSLIDYCLAGDFNIDPLTLNQPSFTRTTLGEAEYQIKYQYFKELIDYNTALPFYHVLFNAINNLINLLPIYTSFSLPPIFPTPLYVSPIPSEQGKSKLSHDLAEYAHNQIQYSQLLQPVLTTSKPEMKSLPVEEKIAFWQQLYSDQHNIQINSASINTVNINEADIIIVDDLYQSGISMWAYAEFLKKNGARSVYGIACVKSLRDSDNT